MDTETLLSFAWVVWLALILLFITIEVFTLDFTFLMLAVGSVGGLIAGLLHLPPWAQIVITAALSILLIFAVRPPLVARLRRNSDPVRSNIEALTGETGTVTASFEGGLGQVKLGNGETWTARLVAGAGAGDEIVSQGDRVIVIMIDGATAVVAPTERNAE